MIQPRIVSFSVASFLMSLLVVSLATTPVNVTAATAGFSGSYTGKLSGSESCVAPSVGGSFASTLTFTISENNGSFTGSGTFLDDDGETGTFQLTGTINTSGQVNGQISVAASVPGTGTFMGTFSGNQLNLSVDVADNGYPGPGLCFTAANGIFTQTSGGGIVVNPEITPSNILTAPILLNTQVNSITGNLNTRIGDVLRGIAVGPKQTATGFMWEGQSGLNAGDGTGSYGIWGSYSYSDFENDFVSTAFDGHRHSVLVGIDIAPRDNIVLGLALGYEGSDIDTGFNRGNQETNGFTIAPYFGYLLTDTISIDASIGYSQVSSDQYRTDPATNTRISSDPDSTRWFGTFNLNGYTTWNNWLLSGRIGFLHARSIQDSFIESNGTTVSESNSKLGQVNIGGEAAYSYGNFEPFARVSYENNFSSTQITVVGGPQPSNDNDDFLFGAGIRYFGDNGLSGNLEWNKRLGLEDYNEDTFTATVRWDF